MFTGIVEEKGQVQAIKKQAKSLELVVSAKKVLTDVHVGDSISVNGVCLTVTRFNETSFSVDVMPETFKATSLARLKPQAEVNLERAMAANGRFGGHFVSGHVDHVTNIVDTWRDDIAKYVKIHVPEDKLKYIVEKGSVTVDGTSLTIFDVYQDGFVISLIPETQKATVLGTKDKGDLVNLEYDVLLKYMERLLTHRQTDEKAPLTEEMLDKYGF